MCVGACVEFFELFVHFCFRTRIFTWARYCCIQCSRPMDIRQRWSTCVAVSQPWNTGSRHYGRLLPQIRCVRFCARANHVHPPRRTLRLYAAVSRRYPDNSTGQPHVAESWSSRTCSRCRVPHQSQKFSTSWGRTLLACELTFIKDEMPFPYRSRWFRLRFLVRGPR